jgi:hypothetical protein
VRAGASARAMLVQVAAQQWQVDPRSCTTANSEVMHKASGRQLSAGALALAASSEGPPKALPPKYLRAFALTGVVLDNLVAVAAPRPRYGFLEQTSCAALPVQKCVGACDSLSVL